MTFETIIGLEVHLKLNSSNKLFCACANVQDFDNLEPNTHVCPVCTGQPGALPVLQAEPLEKALQLGIALGCQVQHRSHFDRKSYFYPDLPMGYQITQQHQPTNIDGQIQFFVDKEFTQTKDIHIRDAHIETDTGKTTQSGEHALLDYNRAGTPLVEIVTQPDLRSADDVIAFLQELQRIARYNNLSDAEMEKGQMRCDVNISLRPAGESVYRPRVEMKNMNSFSAVRSAIETEVERQTALYTAGETVDQETRGRDDATSSSYVMRSKEDAMDYRYMPEPDLPPLVLDKDYIQDIATRVVENPYLSIARYKQDYNFNKEYINALIGDVALQNYFTQLIAGGSDPSEIAKRLVGPIMRRCNEQEVSIDQLALSQEQYIDFLERIKNGGLANAQAKIVMKEMLATGKDPATIIEEKGLHPVDARQIQTRLEEIFSDKSDILTDLQSGNMKPMGFVIGQVMQKSGGAADPKMIQAELKKML